MLMLLMLNLVRVVDLAVCAAEKRKLALYALRLDKKGAYINYICVPQARFEVPVRGFSFEFNYLIDGLD